MKINKDSWHYKLWRSSFAYDERRPGSTDLCRYCHRVFWQVVLRAMFVTIGLVAVGMVLMVLWMLITKALIPHPLTTLGIAAGIAAAITAIVLYVKWLNRSRSYREPQTLIGKYARASKQKVCPLVEFDDE